jgi:hypothetical protein
MKKYPEVNDFLVSTKKLKKFDKAKSFWKVVKVDLCGHDYESLDDENHGTLECKLMAFEGKDFYLEPGQTEQYSLYGWDDFFTIIAEKS